MIVPLLTVILLISSVNSATTSSLMDLPLTMPKGNFMLHATLTDQNFGKKYFMQEYISSADKIEGVIVADTPKDSLNIYYNIKDANGQDSGERLIVQDTDCTLIKFKNSGGMFLPGITKQLTNLLLAMGPSILYRLDHGSIVWKPNPDGDVRGTTMKSFTTTIKQKLDITYYYKSNLDEQTGLQQPSRIVFSGVDPYYSGWSSKEKLILDIYLQEIDKKNDFRQLVKISPGMGCPIYFEPNIPIPKMNAHLVHMILSETVQGPTTTKTVSEVYTYPKLELLRLKTSILGISTEVLYDYALGIVFMFQDGGFCSILPAEITAPGIDMKTGQFDVQLLFQLDGQFNYLGEIFFEHRAGFVVKAWESVQYNVVTNNGKYDKAVVTQYFTESDKNDAFDKYMIVATIIYAYKLDASKKKYQLAEVTTRDYMNFQTAESESEFHDKFTVNGCKHFSKDMTLTFQLGCTESDCIKFAENNVYKLKEQFKESILMNFDMSPLRIAEMDVSFRPSSVNIRMDLLEAPDLENVFTGNSMFVSDESLMLVSKIPASNELDCFTKLSSTYNDFDVALYCADNNLCGTMNGFEKVKEDDKKGHACQVVHVPLHNLQRISREIMLRDLQSRLIQDTSYKTIKLYGNLKSYDYKVVDILDETHDSTDHSRNLFYLLNTDKYLDAQNPTVFTVPDVKNFGDCFRACASEDELECRTLSFCSTADSFSCLITDQTSDKVPIDAKTDTNCAVYTKNHILEYAPIPNRRFKVPSSVSEEKWLDDCAMDCSSNKDCHSFQHCGKICILAGHYTDTATEYDEQCRIFIPRVSEKYKATGKKIVSEVFHTEVNLNQDQCAALCYNWADGENSCESFNFCPKGRSTSSCALTKYSVTDSKTKTIDATNNCYNYELIDSKSKSNKQSTSIKKNGTTGSAAFGIIMIFLTTGLLFGALAPMAYSRRNLLRRLNFNRTSAQDQSFIWTRQIDDQES